MGTHPLTIQGRDVTPPLEGPRKSLRQIDVSRAALVKPHPKVAENHHPNMNNRKASPIPIALPLTLKRLHCHQLPLRELGGHALRQVAHHRSLSWPGSTRVLRTFLGRVLSQRSQG